LPTQRQKPDSLQLTSLPWHDGFLKIWQCLNSGAVY
jgi:hypothetical protein